jgi:hypothetical protein
VGQPGHYACRGPTSNNSSAYRDRHTSNCHTDKDTAWATAALKTWTDRSPWRVAH